MSEKNFKLVGIGEVLWDLLPGGKQLGGAPANFAYHACALGAEGWIVSRVGSDPQGREIIARLEALGLRTDGIEIDPDAPTGTVSVEITAGGQPQFTIHENSAWDHLAGQANARKAVAEADAICFGTLAQRSEASRAAIRGLLALAPADTLRVLDVNLRQKFYSREIIEQSLRRANALKVNDGELPLMAEMFGFGGDLPSQLAQVADHFELRLAACTRGEHGSLLLAEGRWSNHSGVRAKVVDTIGAGDSFTAAMVLGRLAGWDLDEINEQANRVAAHVASCAGATPVLPEELRSRFGASMRNKTNL